MMTFELFGLGSSPDRIDLFCRSEGVVANGIKFWVINGAWHGLYRPNGTMVCYTPWGDTEHKITKSFLDPIPKFRDECYNEAIAWMNDELTEDIEQYLYKKPTALPADWDDDIPF